MVDEHVGGLGAAGDALRVVDGRQPALDDRLQRHLAAVIVISNTISPISTATPASAAAHLQARRQQGGSEQRRITETHWGRDILDRHSGREKCLERQIGEGTMQTLR